MLFAGTHKNLVEYYAAYLYENAEPSSVQEWGELAEPLRDAYRDDAASQIEDRPEDVLMHVYWSMSQKLQGLTSALHQYRTTTSQRIVALEDENAKLTGAYLNLYDESR